MVRNVHHVSRIKPFDLCKCADLGDVPVNPVDLEDTMARIELFFSRVHDAGVIPLSAGGDHLITLPIMRAIAKDRPVGMVHFDAHTDTWDRYFGDSFYTHGTPFRRAVEEGLLRSAYAAPCSTNGTTTGVTSRASGSLPSTSSTGWGSRR
jgi:guanidinopropionase